jgi:hypothetical protein
MKRGKVLTFTLCLIIFIAIFLIFFTKNISFIGATYNVSENLNPTDWIGDAEIYGVAYDSNNRLVYFVGYNGFVDVFGVYNRTSGIIENLSETDPGNWIETNSIKGLTYDSNNDLVYLAGEHGVFGVYNRTNGTTTDLRETDSGDWIGSGGASFIRALTYDSNNDLVYLAGSSGLFGVYNRTNGTTYNLTGADTGNWIGTTYIFALTYDFDNDLVYLAGQNGVFGAYNRTDGPNGTTYNLTGADTGNWIGTTDLNALTYDSNSSLVYLGGDLGKFGVYNRTNGTNGTTTDLSETDPGNWIGFSPEFSDLVYDSNNDLVYLTAYDAASGTGGRFGVYNRTSGIASDLRETDPGDWMGTDYLYSLTYDFDNDLVYL